MALKEEIVKLLANSESPVQNPDFDLEVTSDRQVRGFVISRSFDGLDQLDRQNMMWDYLDAHMPVEKRRRIIILFTLTPDEAVKDGLRPAGGDGSRKKTGAKTKTAKRRLQSRTRAAESIEHSTPHRGRS
jgi:acid stress-induced BolA-like protein IbaG/YrbA